MVTANDAVMFTDGRYFLQAENELFPGWTLMRMGLPGEAKDARQPKIDCINIVSLRISEKLLHKLISTSFATSFQKSKKIHTRHPNDPLCCLIVFIHAMRLSSEIISSLKNPPFLFLR